MRRIDIFALLVAGLAWLATAHAQDIGYWKFDGNTADSSGNGHDGILVSSGGPFTKWSYAWGALDSALYLQEQEVINQHDTTYVKVPDHEQQRGVYRHEQNGLY